MEKTANLHLPYIQPSQAQKHVTHNEALTSLDTLVQLAVLDRDLATPPGAPDDGDRYIVASGATGLWLAMDGKIAAWQDGLWIFLTPQTGWTAFIADETTAVYWSGSAWVEVGHGGALQEISLLGVGTTADGTNPLSAKLNNALFAAKPIADGGNGDMRLKLSKETSDDTVSQIYQIGFSGRAETGLAGDDDFTLKVSADGSAWRDAMIIDHTSGKARFPQTNFLTDGAVNLYQDSGRFAGNAVTTVSVGAFAMPAYFSLQNSTLAAGHAKFITDNTDYGGAGGALNSDVKALIDTIRDASARRYGLEFWVAKMTQGAGTGSSLSHLSTTYYASLLSALRSRTPKMTFHAYVRALDDAVLIRQYSGQTIYRNGVALAGHGVVVPLDGWVSIRIADSLDPRYNSGYSPSTFGVYAKASAHRWLMACPVLVAGLTTIDVDTGVVAAYNGWPA